MDKNPKILLDEPISEESLIIFKLFNDFYYPFQNLLTFINKYLNKQCQKEILNDQTLFLIALNYEICCYVNKIEMENDFIQKIIKDFLLSSSKEEVDMKNSTFAYLLCKVYYRNNPSSLNENLILFEDIFLKNKKKFFFEKDFCSSCLKFMSDISDLSGNDKIDDFLRRKILHNASHDPNFLYSFYQAINNEDHPFFKEEVVLFSFLLLKYLI